MTSRLQERQQRGRALRDTCSRKSHTEQAQHQRDPIELLRLSSEGRLPRLVPLRYGRMLASPFTFYRGTALLQAHDLATTPISGLRQPICGDCHLMNFGGFASPERTLLFGINDFDEAHPGPWEWDIKRLAASFMVAARHLNHGDKIGKEAAYSVAASYQKHMQRYTHMGELDIWYEKISFETLLAHAGSAATRQRIERGIHKAKGRTHKEILPKLAEKTANGWRIRDSLPSVFHLQDHHMLFNSDDQWLQQDDWQQRLDKMMHDYQATLVADRKILLNRYQYQDTAFKVVGVGSVGTRCMMMLLTDVHEQPLFLQLKEARPSVLAKYAGSATPYQQQGRRVVEGQRLMQVASDIFLGWATSPSGRHFYFRQLRDMKLSPEVEMYSSAILLEYAELCGWVLARAHAKAGGLAPEISGYLGQSDVFAQAISHYSARYADQVERDFEKFTQACRSGKLIAQTEADFASDLRV